MTAKILFACFGVLALLANASLGASHNLVAFFIDADFVYEIDVGDVAVIPKLERDKRQRAQTAAPAADGKTPVALVLRRDRGGLQAQLVVLPEGAPPRFHHLDERPSLSRAPPPLA
ncbi:MAG TPA: hypothetical protein VK035_03145 [Kiloniellales bacterium]|nr:hypothetical protein [Kiloniellales bacterium]